MAGDIKRNFMARLLRLGVRKNLRMRTVLGLDLGCYWYSIGAAVLSFEDRKWIGCKLGAIEWPESACTAAEIAKVIVEFSLERQISAVSIDGPQGWRDPTKPGNFVGRECERMTGTPGKTGTFGTSYPAT